MISSTVSIIVPVFNVEKYVSRCIDSLLKQTYTNLEIIIIDDGSSDNTFSICQSFLQKDERIKLVQLKENMGVSTARNVGIKNSSGTYIMFVDGDDFLSPKAVELLINDFNDPNLTMSSFQLKVFQDDDLTSVFENSLDVVTKRPNNEVLTDLLYWRINTSSCCKLYKASKIKELTFAEDRHINEDRFFVFEYLLNGNGNICEHSISLYGCVERSQSACRSAFSSKYDDMIFFANLICENVNKINDLSLTNAANYNLVKTYLMYVKYALRSKNWKENIGKCKDVIKKVNIFLKKNQIKLGKHRLELFILNLSIKLYRILLRCFDKITNKKTY